jgi:hypothetical protein
MILFIFNDYGYSITSEQNMADHFRCFTVVLFVLNLVRFFVSVAVLFTYSFMHSFIHSC